MVAMMPRDNAQRLVNIPLMRRNGRNGCGGRGGSQRRIAMFQRHPLSASSVLVYGRWLWRPKGDGDGEGRCANGDGVLLCWYGSMRALMPSAAYSPNVRFLPLSR